jgi:hypothetical protein
MPETHYRWFIAQQTWMKRIVQLNYLEEEDIIANLHCLDE